VPDPACRIPGSVFRALGSRVRVDTVLAHVLDKLAGGPLVHVLVAATGFGSGFGYQVSGSGFWVAGSGFSRGCVTWKTLQSRGIDHLVLDQTLEPQALGLVGEGLLIEQ